MTAIWIFGLMLLSSFAAGLVMHITRSPWSAVGAESVDAAIVVTFAILCRGELVPFLRLRTIVQPPRRLLEMVAVSCAAGAIFVLYFRLLDAIGAPIDSTEPDYVRSAWNLWIVVATVAMAPPIFEELAFRGIIQSRLELVLKPTEAVVVQAALFAVLHLSPLIFLSHFMMGLYLGYLRRRSKSLYFGVLAHAAWNTMVLASELHWM